MVYRCRYCGFTTDTPGDLEAHIRGAHPKPPPPPPIEEPPPPPPPPVEEPPPVEAPTFKCPFCGAVRDSQHSLNIHIASIHKEEAYEVLTKPWVADLLGLSLDDPLVEVGLAAVKESAGKVATFTCPVCGSVFSSSSGLMKHVKAAHPDQTTTVVRTIYRIWEHTPGGREAYLKYIEEMKPPAPPGYPPAPEEEPPVEPPVYACPYCGFTTDTPEDLEAHIRGAHPTPPEFVCEFCGAIFSTFPDLVAHIEAEHPGQPPPTPPDKKPSLLPLAILVGLALTSRRR